VRLVTALRRAVGRESGDGEVGEVAATFRTHPRRSGVSGRRAREPVERAHVRRGRVPPLARRRVESARAPRRPRSGRACRAANAPTVSHIFVASRRGGRRRPPHRDPPLERLFTTARSSSPREHHAAPSRETPRDQAFDAEPSGDEATWSVSEGNGAPVCAAATAAGRRVCRGPASGDRRRDLSRPAAGAARAPPPSAPARGAARRAAERASGRATSIDLRPRRRAGPHAPRWCLSPPRQWPWGRREEGRPLGSAAPCARQSACGASNTSAGVSARFSTR
jgi:hypothetical protein